MSSMIEYIIGGGGMIALFVAVMANNNHNSKKVSRVYERMDECKEDVDKKFQTKEVCSILQTQLANDINEIKLDVKTILRKNGFKA